MRSLRSASAVLCLQSFFFPYCKFSQLLGMNLVRAAAMSTNTAWDLVSHTNKRTSLARRRRIDTGRSQAISPPHVLVPTFSSLSSALALARYLSVFCPRQDRLGIAVYDTTVFLCTSSHTLGMARGVDRGPIYPGRNANQLQTPPTAQREEKAI